MRILFEEYQYPAEKVKGILDGITRLRDVNDKISVNYVGYYYNPTLEDCVFILPKVLLEDVGGQELAFGHCLPEDIIHLEKAEGLTETEEKFIYELSVWIYRAIVVYNDSNRDNGIVKRQYVTQMSKGRIRQCNTFLDILLAIQKFNRENQDFFFFILRNIHSGFNKINWTRTIAKSQAIVQDEAPVYLNPVNKKRQINFDEELLIIFFSILNYMHEVYGFPVQINVSFPLITGNRFEQYKRGMGCVRLHQIKYKYFSDKALYLWELCYAFFDQSRKINVETNEQEYLLVSDFNIVFEAIIDELVGDPRSAIPDDLKDQPDGKRVDHIYKWKELTNNEDDKPIYYIGDSKYYKRKTPVGENSVYKQYTYARNVIQWNLDLFNQGKNGPEDEMLRDDITEGYNIIPNFFISAQQNELKMEDDIKKDNRAPEPYVSYQFNNRLFDRDTLLITHYDVNFLFIIALYGRNSKQQKEAWKEKVRDMFRTDIQNLLNDKFDFYAMTAKEGVNAPNYIQDHFQQLLGKLYVPFKDRGLQKYYSLALDKAEPFEDENAVLLDQLKGYFYIAPCLMGQEPYSLLKEVNPVGVPAAVPNQFLTRHYLERYQEKEVLIGCYHDQAHLDWILGKNDKGTLIYNVRLDKSRAGAQGITAMRKKEVSFVILYQEGHESDNVYRVFQVHHHAVMEEDRMREAWYPNPKGRYFCYVFSEEVSLGDIDLNSLFFSERFQNPAYTLGAPIFKTGKELMEYRK